jgi:hypothetical protein
MKRSRLWIILMVFHIWTLWLNTFKVPATGAGVERSFSKSDRVATWTGTRHSKTIVETMLYKEFLSRLGHPLNEAKERQKAKRKKNKKKIKATSADGLGIRMMTKTGGSDCYLEFISNSNVNNNSAFWRPECRFVRYILPKTPNKHEQIFLGSLVVRFCSFRAKLLFCLRSNRTNRTNSNLHCSASHLQPLGRMGGLNWLSTSLFSPDGCQSVASWNRRKETFSIPSLHKRSGAIEDYS